MATNDSPNAAGRPEAERPLASIGTLPAGAAFDGSTGAFRKGMGSGRQEIGRLADVRLAYDLPLRMRRARRRFSLTSEASGRSAAAIDR